MGAKDETARIESWDGKPPTTCDSVQCAARPVIALNIAAINEDGTLGEYRGFVQLCEEHLDDLVPQARGLLIVNGRIEPNSPTEHNLRTAMQEHAT